MIPRIPAAWFLILALGAVALAADPAGTPARAKKPEPPRPGLIATVSDGKTTATLQLASPSFVLEPGESIHPQLAPSFTARFQGVLVIRMAGQYTLSGPSAAIRIGDQDAAGKALQLARGEYPIIIEYTRPPGPARFQLLWQSDSFPVEPVPSDRLGHRDEPAALAAGLRMERGRMLVENLDCVACHAGAESLVGRQGPDLTGIGWRLSKSWIYKWLENPQHFRADAAMPVLLSKEENRRSVATFLANLKDGQPAKEEPASKQEEIDTGANLFETVGCALCHTDERNPLAGLGSKYSHTSLTAYLEDPLKFDPSGRMPNMLLSHEEAAALSGHLMQSKNPEYEAAAPDGDLRTGEMLVRVIGCLNCHRIHGGDGKPLTPMMAMRVASLAQADVTGGCISDQPRAPMPIYALSPEDKQAIRAFLLSIQKSPDISPAPAYQWRRTTQKMGCIACHSLDENAAPEGNEHVPPLTASGLKLRRTWIEQVLLKKQRVRPWLNQRMPHFGEAVKGVPHQIVAASGAAPLREPPKAEAEKIKLGQHLLGPTGDGYGCTGCHAYKGSDVTVPPESRGPEMTGMAARVRPDWFGRWVRDPQRILPGTAMPSFFIGKPEEVIQQQIDALWAYISLGQEMPPPEGLVLQPGAMLAPADGSPMFRPHGDGVYSAGRQIQSLGTFGRSHGWPSIASHRADDSRAGVDAVRPAEPARLTQVAGPEGRRVGVPASGGVPGRVPGR